MAARLCVITGAGSGIGRALTVAVTRRGLDVLAVGRRKDPLEETKKIVEQDEKSTGSVAVVPADVSTEEGRAAVANAVPEDKSGIYVVHNAAVIEPIAYIENMPLDKWRKLMAINVEGPLFLTQALLPRLSNGGRILNVGSGLAHRGLDGLSAYGMSKAAVFLMHETMKLEFKPKVLARIDGLSAYGMSKAAVFLMHKTMKLGFKPKGILSGSVSPGMVDTPMQVNIRSASSEKFKETRDNVFAASYEKGGVRSAELVAQFVAWVLCDTSDDEFPSAEWSIKDESHYPRWHTPDVK